MCIEESQSSLETGTSPDSGINDESEKQLNFQNANFLAMQHAGSAQMTQLQCNICHKQMISFQALNRHKRNYHSDSKCVYCRRKFGNRFQLKVHVQFKHPQKFDEFRLNGQVNAIVQVEPIAAIPECCSCEMKFADKDALQKHHADCDQHCIECSITLPSKEEYSRHVEKTHTPQSTMKTLECPFGCTFEFKSEKHLLNHVQKSHPDDTDKEIESFAETVSEGEDSVSTEASSGLVKLGKARNVLSARLNQARITTRRNSVGFPIKAARKEMRSLLKNKWIAQKLSSMTPSALASVTQGQLTKNAKKYTKQEFVSQFLLRKDPETLYCVPCKKDMGVKSLPVHLKSKHAAVKCFRCEICPEAFFRQDYRSRHMSYAHVETYNCRKCKVQFDRAYKFDAHMEKHGVKSKNFKPNENEDKYDLPQTNMLFIEDVTTFDFSHDTIPAQRVSIDSSQSTSTPSEAPMTKEVFVSKHMVDICSVYIRCTPCDVNVSKKNIVSHLIWKHAVQKPLKCSFCNGRVNKNRARLMHMAKCHPNDYKCEDCGLQFAKYNSYYYHVMEEHRKKVTTKQSSGEERDLGTNDLRFVAMKNEDDYEDMCDESDMAETNDELMIPVIPQIVKNPENIHPCGYCGKAFASPKNLQLHKSHKHRKEMAMARTKIHSEGSSDAMSINEFRRRFTFEPNDQDVTCKICNMTLRQKNFGAHLKSRHATTGAFLCAMCPENFYRPEERMQHMSQSHRGTFFCTTCGIQFYRNSRYARHMLDVHKIMLNAEDESEVDLNLDELLYVDYIRRSDDQDERDQLSATIKPNQPQKAVDDGSMTRDVFLARFVKTVNRDMKRCVPCGKNMTKTSMHHHLIGFHATQLPYKCSFCPSRFERGAHRGKHLEIYHPNEYKCNECGVQFAKHSLFLEHMLVEHNIHAKTNKSPEEEKDLGMNDLMFQEKRKIKERVSGYEDYSSSSVTDLESPAKHKFLKPRIKDEPVDPDDNLLVHSIFGNERSLAEELINFREESVNYGEELSYSDFKAQYVIEIDHCSNHCNACDMLVPKTSTTAHLRLWHASTDCYKCEICSEGFKRQDYRQRHYKAVHPNDYNCDLCDIQFIRAASFKDHMKENHNKILLLPEPMTKDEVDVPLEKLKFVLKVK